MFNKNNDKPLADKMRPSSFDNFFGQAEIVGKGKMLRKLIESNELSSLILWGPPGTGKTTLAYIISLETGANFVNISAVMSGKSELKKIIAEAEKQKDQKTILFIDEIHRWNKAQQDALLPYVENGTIILIGATTENPSFEINKALLSRSRVFILKNLSQEDLVSIINRALENKDNGLGKYDIKMDEQVKIALAQLAGGDARVVLNSLELIYKSKNKNKKIEVTIEDIKESLQRTHLIFDKKGEEFYNLISALHKSMRGGDADAALYWLARMLEAGADPLYVARRVLRFASEDIGMANAEAMVQANIAFDACHKIGYPECSVHLAQAVVYCAKSTKSNILYKAYEEAAIDARNTSELGVPLHLRNAPTKFMKDIGYSKGYKYNPDIEGDVDQDYLPESLKNKKYLTKGKARWDVYMKAQKDKKKKI